MQNPDKQEALVARIRKLMAMTEAAGCTEAEASNAASRIQAILAEHNIDMAEVASISDAPEKREKTAHQRAAMYRYQRTLMAALAKNNFCMHFINEVTKPDPRGRFGQRTVKCHFLLGRMVNVHVTAMTYDYLVDTMDRLLPYLGMQKRGKEALLWLEGCTDRLVERLDERREAAEAESAAKAREERTRRAHPGAATDGRALVVLTDVYGTEEELNLDALHGFEPGHHARVRAERERRNSAVQALKDQGIRFGVAWDMVNYGLDRAAAEARNPEQVSVYEAPDPTPETEAQRSKRRQRDERESARYWERLGRKQRAEDERRSHPDYLAGRRTADNVGLDNQVNQTRKGRLS